MKYIKQILIILLFTFAGQLLQAIIPLPIPAAIYGLVLLFLALCSGLLKPEHIDQTARFMISILPVLFVAPAVNILEHWGIIAPQLGSICTIVLVSTVLTFVIAGRVTGWLVRKGGGENG